MVAVAPRGYRFEGYRLDLVRRRILDASGAPIPLSGRAFDVLAHLIEHRDVVVSKDALMLAVWPHLVVEENNLSQAISSLRRVFGDPRDVSRVIATVQGRGYRFVANVEVDIADSDDSDDAPDGSTPTTSAAPKATPAAHPPQRKRRYVWVSAAVLAVVVVAVAWLVTRSEPGSISIVVLPFENLTGDGEYDYLAVGLAEETSVSLAQIGDARLRVIGDVSAKAISQASSATDLGRSLGVDFIARSTLQVEGSSVRVNARLLRVADREQIWSAVFDRQLTDVLGLQRELSVALAEQIRLRLSPEVAAAIDARQTRSPDAYRLYLKGRHAWNKFTPASFREALGFFRQAAAADAKYALAWAGIAQTLTTSQIIADAPPQTIAADARDAIARAQRYGPGLAEVWNAAGYFSNFIEWDVTTALSQARKSVMLDPNSATAHMFLGVMLLEIGEFGEALNMMRRARELDPLWAQAFALSAMVANYAGDHDAALNFARQAIAIAPDAFVGHLQLGNIYFALGRYEEALAAYAAVERLSGGNSRAYSSRARTLARMGRVNDVRAILDALRARAQVQDVPPYTFAAVHTALGEFDAAFEWLERALEVRDVSLLGLDWDSDTETLRTDVRFASLIARCGCATRGVIGKNE